MHLLRQTWLLTRNDLRQELRQLELVVTAGFFTLVVLIMFALAFSTLDDEVQPRAVPGMIWLCLAFVGALTLDVGCRLQRATTTTRSSPVGDVRGGCPSNSTRPLRARAMREIARIYLG